MAELEDKRKSKDPIAEKYSAIGWGVFLILVGAVMVLPHALVPEGFLWIAGGVIMIAYRTALVARGVEASVGFVVAGVVLIAIGLSEIIDIDIDLLPVILIVAGVLLLSKAVKSGD